MFPALIVHPLDLTLTSRLLLEAGIHLNLHRGNNLLTVPSMSILQLADLLPLLIQPTGVESRARVIPIAAILIVLVVELSAVLSEALVLTRL